MRVAPKMLLATAVAVAVGACGAPSEHARVASYIRQVNRIEAALRSPFARVTDAGTHFVSTLTGSASKLQLSLLPYDERQTRAALTKITSVRARLAALPAPTGAGRLRTLLMRLLGDEAQMTNELSGMITFLPAFEQALRALPSATQDLQGTLTKAAQPPADKAHALLAYRRKLESALEALARLRPPPVSAPQYHAQVTSLRALASASKALAHAITSDTEAAPAALVRFDRGAAAADTLTAQRAAIRAVHAYNKKAAAISTLTHALEADEFNVAPAAKLNP